ncbi:hypothetical protein AB0N62_34690 [Streptomyces sp. NPDC093982]|uniref:hypothetical protein n=1 Tax=Streptomyces sp. NPDC093982 TaxID=3155077 RepID=UPI003419D81B
MDFGFQPDGGRGELAGTDLKPHAVTIPDRLNALLEADVQQGVGGLRACGSRAREFTLRCGTRT